MSELNAEIAQNSPLSGAILGVSRSYERQIRFRHSDSQAGRRFFCNTDLSNISRSLPYRTDADFANRLPPLRFIKWQPHISNATVSLSNFIVFPLPRITNGVTVLRKSRQSRKSPRTIGGLKTLQRAQRFYRAYRVVRVVVRRVVRAHSRDDYDYAYYYRKHR